MKIALLGLAHGHVHSYCQQWREHPEWGIEVATAWDQDADRLAKAAGGEPPFPPASSLAAVLQRDDIGAVMIASETAYHADLVEQAAAAGKAIALQKPLALTLDEADRIVRAVRQHGVPFTLAWQMRVDPHNHQIRDLIRSGQFGRPLIVRRRHCLATHLWKDFEKSWHVDPRLNRDIFADDAAHPLDFFYWLLGQPVSVTGELGTLVNPRVVNDNAIVILRYADGTFGEMVCSFTATGGETCTEVTCERGTIIHNFGDAVTTNAPWPPGAIQLKWIAAGDKEWTISTLPETRRHGDRLAALAKPLAEFFHGKRPPIATAEEGRDVLRLVLACYKSARDGRRIAL